MNGDRNSNPQRLLNLSKKLSFQTNMKQRVWYLTDSEYQNLPKYLDNNKYPITSMTSVKVIQIAPYITFQLTAYIPDHMSQQKDLFAVH